MNLLSWAIKHGISQEALSELEWMLKYPTGTTSEDGKESEAGVSQGCRLKAPYRDGILWRNNVGVLPDRNGTPVRYGLANDSPRINKVTKSSDLIGVTRIQYQGRTFGVFTAIETKAPKWVYGRYKSTAEREEAQLNYINLVRTFGGIAGFATSVDDYENLINGYCNEL